MARLRKIDWIIIAVILLFSVLPDPLDFLDMGLPVLEPLLAFMYYWWRSRKK